MRRLYIVLLFVFTGTLAFSQPPTPTEICNNGLDDDFDGFIDCYDGSCASSPLCDGIFLGNDAACKAVPPAFPQFTMALDFASPNETTNHLSRMAIGDLDRDGIPEMVTMNRFTKKLFILNGNNGSVKHQTTVTWEPYWEVAIANLDNDACGEIYFIGEHDPPGNNNSGFYIFAYDCQLNLLWTTAQRLRGDPINFGIADFDGDGQEELYAKDEVYDAKTGVRIIASTGTTYNRINGGPVAADVVGDDKLELIVGLNIYQVNLGTRAANTGSLTLLQNRPEYFVRNEYNATSIADYNLDGKLDILASGSTIANNTNTTVFLWDVFNNTVKTYSDPQPALGGDYTNGWKNGTGRLNIADLDGNGKMNASYVSGRFLYALDENFNLLWRVNINEETSGHTGCTLFDFNGDGKAEIVYRDERFIYIIEGTDGSIYSQQACISRTNREYPIVADVDADGSTELCVPCGYIDSRASANFNTLDSSRYSHIRVFKSAAEPWVPARRVWNQHGYFVVNVNDDLTIPTKLQPHQLVFSTGNCTQGPNRPLNKFLNQSPYLNSEGCPTYAAPDIAFHVAPTVKAPTCPDLNFLVSFKITNKGDVALTGNIPVSFYTSDPTQAGATKLATVNVAVNQLGTGDIASVDDQVITGIGSEFVYVVLNDAGTTVPTPISLPNTTFIECDYDNIRFARINPLPVAITGVAVSPNETCNATPNGVARAFIPGPGGTENTTDYNFYWSNGAVGKPIPADFTGAVRSNIPAGTYTVYARHKTANCNSDTTQVVVGSTTATFPPVTINVLSNQTSCAPFNGKLEAVIQGGGSGFTISWFDQALDPLGISGPIANNLKAGSYLAVIEKGTCNTSVPATINPPTVPDAQADVLLDVVDCSNPNSGSVTADALVSGIPQNPANYTFIWYEYDAVNGQGSVLDASHGTGHTRTGLPVGFYQVEVKENTSQCLSTIKPIVEVESDLNFPDPPQIQILSSQTSCNPLTPNGVMTANVFVNGVAQDPANYTFEWFKGQNTSVVVSTVSDVNGKTVNQVAGGGIPYTVRVTNQFNCSAIADLPITENIISPVVTLAQLTPNTICDPAEASVPFNGSLVASVTFNGSTVTLPDNNYQFEWRNPANGVITVTDNKNPILSGLVHGNPYSVTVRRMDVACTSAPDTEPVLQATVLPALDTDSQGSNTCVALATPDGSVTVNVTNGLVGETFKYQWYNGNAVVAGSEVPTAVNNGNQQTAIKLGGPLTSPTPYTVQVTNNNTGCKNSATEFVVDESVIPVISFLNVTPNTICAPVSNFNGGLTSQIDNQIGAITDYTFTWYNGATNTPGNVNNSSTGVQLSGVGHGSYTVEVLNTATGCKSTPITNQVPDGRIFPAITFDPTGSTNCSIAVAANGSIEANVTNGGTNFSYAWTAVGTAPALVAGNMPTAKTLVGVGGPTFGAPPHSYQVVVINTDTQCSGNNVGQVPDLSVKPTLVLDADPNTVCTTGGGGPANFNGNIEVTAVNHPNLAGPITYQWYDADAAGVPGAAIPGQTASSITNRGADKFGVTATIVSLGCTSEINVEEIVDLVALPNIDAIATPNLNCPSGPIVNNGSALVNSVDGNPVPGTYTFQWYTGAVVTPGQIRMGDTNPVLATNLAENQTFTVEVKNLANGCIGSETVTVTDGRITPTASISIVQHNQNCTGTPNGALLASASNAGTNFTFTWSPVAPPSIVGGADGQNFTQLAAGAYDVFVTNDDTGCQSAVDTETILNNFVFPAVTLTVQPQSSCVSQNGSVTANNPGGRTFAWYTGIGTASPLATDVGDPAHLIDDLATNDYTVEVVISATGCKTTQTTFVPTQIVPPSIALVNTKAVEICGPLPSGAVPDGAASVTLGAITSIPAANFSVFYVRTQVINGVGAGTFPTDPAIIKASPEVYNGGAMPPSKVDLAPGYLTALVVDNNTGCESTPNTVAILDNTSNYDINVVGVASAGQCNTATPGGGVAVDVLKNGAPCTTCTYEWYDATPINSNINFFNNPPDMGGAGVITTAQDLGHPNPVGGVSAGDYTLVVIDSDNGCGAYEIENIPSLQPAPVVITPVQPTECVNASNPTNNGEIHVTVNEFPGQTEGYTVNIFAGNSASGLPLTSDVANASATFTVDLLNLNSGNYFVQVIDEFLPNKPCPQGFPVTLLSTSFNPSITINQINPNTSCDPTSFSDGSVQLTVIKDPADQSLDQNYEVVQITPQPRIPVAVPLLIGASGNSNSSITLNTFQPQTVQPNYVIRVQDNLSSCFKDVTVIIPDAKDMPSVLTVTPNPETNCSNATQNNSNGSALAQLADPTDTENLFDFTWAKTSTLALPSVVFTAAGNNALTGGELLNQSKTGGLADWTMGPVGQGSGDRTYFVQASKNTGSGRACKTGIMQVVIPDAHIKPNLTLTPSADSFCNADALNGVIGDGQIQVVADANPGLAGQQIPPGGFAYDWTPVPTLAAPTPVQTNTSATFIINQLGDGDYTLTVRNTQNECVVVNNTTVAPAPLVINLSSIAVLDQRICNNDGEIKITGVTILNQSTNAVVQNNVNAAIDPLYTFQWYNTPAMTATTELEDGGNNDITGRTLSIDGDGDFLTEAGDFATMQAGIYYVVGRRSASASFAADCPTLPIAVVVNDVHKNPVVDLDPLSNTSCVAGTGDGEIAINVTDATDAYFGPFTFDYTWTLGGLSNSTSNNGNGTNDGDADQETDLLDGNYTVTVANPASGCSSVATVEVLKNSSPIFIQNVTPTDQIRCLPVSDGSLTVTSITLNDRNGNPQTLPVSDFTFDWARPGAPLVIQNTAGAILNPATAGVLNPMGAGDYNVIARRIGPAGSLGINCASAPFTAVIVDKRVDPVVSLTPFANTACDPLFAEGSIEVRVSDQTLVPGPHTFSYTWAATNPTAIGASASNNGNGSNADADGDVPANLLHNNLTDADPTNDTYRVTVVNNQSGCDAVGSTTIFRNSTPIIIPLAVATPQVLCSPHGTIEVNSVEVIDRDGNVIPGPFSDFDFLWSRTTLVPTIATTDGALGQVPGGTILDNSVYASIGTGQYFVVARRVGGTLGRGCESAPYHATILDQRVFPELTFTQLANSSCTPINPNGTLVANAREVNGVNTDGYTFGWAMVAPATVSPASIQTVNAANNASTLSNAIDGNYLVTATNTQTACAVTSPVTLVLDQSLSTPNIISVNTVDPIDCNPTGSASVTKITLGSTTNSILFPPNLPPNNEVTGAGLNAFNYEWYQGSIGAGNQLPVGGPFTTTPTINALLTGTYFVVVHDPFTDCRSGGREVVISPDDIVYPALNIQQTALQISCIAGIGSAQLAVTADGQTDADPNYTFTWFPNGTNSGSSIANTSTLSNITAGTYSVTVHDNTTNCSIADNYIVEDDTQEFSPVISMASQPRTLCVGTDGELFARVLNLSPLYPYPYNSSTFTADLYFGSSPNLAGAPDMPSIPNTVGFIGNFSQDNLNEGFYTVRIRDNNTGCFATALEEIKDARKFPLVVVQEMAPVTNCDPARPNGVAQVTADATFVGYTFDWYEGTTATGTPVYSGAEFGELKVKPQQYTIRATNTTTGCFSDVNTDIESGTVPIPPATIEVLSHVTSCVMDNGALMAYVGADKNQSGYIFHWYDGTIENPPADNIGETYTELAEGQYSVTATSIVTGCKSPLVTEEILNKQELPNFDFVIQNTTCDKNDGFATLIMISDVPVERIEWSNSEGPFLTGPNFTDAGAGIYEITATTFLGCQTTKQIEIKPDIRPYNGISRNNDGRNEIFQIDCIQNFPTNLVKIFNRAGTLVYEAEGYDNSSTFFDGNSNRGISPMGVSLPDGTYFYIVDKRDGSKPLAGYLEIVK